MQAQAEILFDRMTSLVGRNLPPGVSPGLLWTGPRSAPVAADFPTGFLVPDEHGPIHEFYTPTKVAREVARVVRLLVPAAPGRRHGARP